jgi:hypothetical protein
LGAALAGSSVARRALLPEKGRADALAELLEATKDFGQKDESLSSSFRAFLAALSSRLGSFLREGNADAELADASSISRIEGIAALVREASNDYETLNRNPGLIAETLMYAIGEASR